MSKKIVSFLPFLRLHVLAPFKSAVKSVVKKEKIVGGLLASSKSKKAGKMEKHGKHLKKTFLNKKREFGLVDTKKCVRGFAEVSTGFGKPGSQNFYKVCGFIPK
jgi:hypothetical protein